MFSRVFVVYDPLWNTVKSVITNGVSHADFTYERRGGAKSGRIDIAWDWLDRYYIGIGDWVEYWYDGVVRVYSGRVVSREAKPEGGISLTLQGPLDLLADIKIGSRNQKLYYGSTIPKEARRERNAILVKKTRIDEIVWDILQRYLNNTPQNLITAVSSYIEPTAEEVGLLRFDGNVDLIGALNDLALRAGNYTWGVDEAGYFYFHPVRASNIFTFQVGVNARDVTERESLNETFNHVTVRGGWKYSKTTKPEQLVYERVDFPSMELYGIRKVEAFSPLVINEDDAIAFADAILDNYSLPSTEVKFTVPDVMLTVFDITGVRLLDTLGGVIIEGDPHSMKVNFDQAFECNYTFKPFSLKRPVEKWDNKLTYAFAVEDGLITILGTTDGKTVYIYPYGTSEAAWLGDTSWNYFYCCHTPSTHLSKKTIGQEFIISPFIEIAGSSGQYEGSGYMEDEDPDIPSTDYAPGGGNIPVDLPTMKQVTFLLVHRTFLENPGEGFGWTEEEGDRSSFEIVEVRLPKDLTWSQFVGAEAEATYRIEQGTVIVPRESPRWVKVVEKN